jgi:hypothetical protein
MVTSHPFNFNKWVFLIGTISLFLGFGFSIQGCDKMKTTEERKIAVMIKTNPMPTVVIPPIDSSASLKTETATFALG